MAKIVFLGPRAAHLLFFGNERERRRTGRPQPQGGAPPAAEQRRRALTEAPDLRNCLRCSKIECSTS
jgi:hypothetical protein